VSTKRTERRRSAARAKNSTVCCMFLMLEVERVRRVLIMTQSPPQNRVTEALEKLPASNLVGHIDGATAVYLHTLAKEDGTGAKAAHVVVSQIQVGPPSVRHEMHCLAEYVVSFVTSRPFSHSIACSGQKAVVGEDVDAQFLQSTMDAIDVARTTLFGLWGSYRPKNGYKHIDDGHRLVDGVPVDVKAAHLQSGADIQRALVAFLDAIPPNYPDNALIANVNDYPLTMHLIRLLNQSTSFHPRAGQLVILHAFFHAFRSARGAFQIVYYDNLMNPLYQIISGYRCKLPVHTLNFDRTSSLIFLLQNAWLDVRADALSRIKDVIDARGGLVSISITYFLWLFEESISVLVDLPDACRGNNFDAFVILLPRVVRLFMTMGRRHYRHGFVRYMNLINKWSQTGHPMLAVLRDKLETLDEVTVEYLIGRLMNSARQNASNVLDAKSLEADGRKYINGIDAVLQNDELGLGCRRGHRAGRRQQQRAAQYLAHGAVAREYVKGMLEVALADEKTVLQSIRLTSGAGPAILMYECDAVPKGLTSSQMLPPSFANPSYQLECQRVDCQAPGVCSLRCEAATPRCYHVAHTP